jgi:FkbM family methyltransferase
LVHLRFIIERALHLTKILTNIKNRLVNKVLVRVGGFHKLVDSTSAFIISPRFEKRLWDYLNLEEGDVFIDVGSHIGKYTIPAARLVGSSGLVISVEPHPENYAVLVENVMLNKLTNVIALNVAAWDRECYLRLFIGDSAGHSVKRNYGSGYIVVRALPIDLIIKELNVRVVDFIKIDVEGAELEVLKGLSNTLKEFKPKLIIEVSEENKDKVFKFLENYGYIAEAIHGLDNYYFFKPK